MKKLLVRVFKDHGIQSFAVAVMCFGLVTGLFSGVLNNFLYEILKMDETQRGWLELPRELPGLLLLAVMAVFFRFSEYRIFQIALISSTLGLLGLALLGHSMGIAVTMIFFWSLGEHLVMPVRSAVAIHHAQPGKEGLAMGTIKGFQNSGQALGFYLGPLLLWLFSFTNISERFTNSYGPLFIVCVLFLVVSLFLSRGLVTDKEKVQRKKLYFHRKFTKYYGLEIFFGARKQVFLTFAPFVLITVYGAGPQLVSLLYGIWSVANIFVAPMVGKLLDKVGYKKVLVWDSVFLIVLCLLYGFAPRFLNNSHAFILTAIVFVLDSISFALGLARDVYVKSKSENKEEFTSTLSTGLSVNHLISIGIAIVGGFLWKNLGMEVLFSVAALIGLGSFFFSLSLRSPSEQSIDP